MRIGFIEKEKSYKNRYIYEMPEIGQRFRDFLLEYNKKWLTRKDILKRFA
ncbi:MAG: hypothetical protein ACFFB0_19135 [Promethearchaeota archaeon]